jgi:hypothetical protein
MHGGTTSDETATDDVVTGIRWDLAENYTGLGRPSADPFSG